MNNYKKQGDYYIPDISLPPQIDTEIGIWGKAHLRYLIKHKRTTYHNLLTTCTLLEYLSNIDKLAEETYDMSIKYMAAKENVTEELKTKDMFEWIRRMNNIRNRAREIVYETLIYA